MTCIQLQVMGLGGPPPVPVHVLSFPVGRRACCPDNTIRCELKDFAGIQEDERLHFRGLAGVFAIWGTMWVTAK